jgi:gas vesicle protein
MKTKYLLLAVLVGALALVGCSDTPDTIEEAATSLPDVDDVQALAGDIQNEMSDIATEIEGSEAAEELQAAWSDIQTEITAAVAAVSEDGSIDTDAVRDELENFQSEMDDLGDQVSAELRSSWAELREKLEQLMG